MIEKKEILSHPDRKQYVWLGDPITDGWVRVLNADGEHWGYIIRLEE